MSALDHPAARQIATGTPLVLARVDAGVGVVTLNRPERRNALHIDMVEAVPPILDRFADDPDVGCVLITGSGTAFCAGGDLRERLLPDVTAQTGIQTAAGALKRATELVQSLSELSKVTIAALPGPAVGAGLSIALAADLRIASASAMLIPGWGRMGLSGDFGGAWLLTRLIGPSRTLGALMDGSPIDAPTALSMGLVNKVVDSDDFARAALDWARAFGSGPSQAWSAMKANVRDAERLSLADALATESQRMMVAVRSADHRNAVRKWRSDNA